MEWSRYFEPYELALQELKINLRGIRKQYKTKGMHSPIEFVSGRIKTIPSIIDKLDKMGLSIKSIDEVYDIAGIRINCQFVEDIYAVVELLSKRQDLDIIETRDYIINQRESGYKSYHIHAYYHLETIDGLKKVMVEFQIRTLAMNFWAIIEHSLNYKYDDQIPEEIKDRLKQAAEAASWLDAQMSAIRDEIAEAQQTFEKRQAEDRKDLELPTSFTTNEDYLTKKYKGDETQ
ncbi:MAG: GTP pyrophosphokinase family protein [Turicibacter sp.]|nr:GTP pyrophosphokinase family protein [Turicibacter sp.]